MGTVSSASSQAALLATNMCASGLTATSVFRLPAGTASNAPFICLLGSADPQMEQKLLTWRVDGRVNCLTLSSPETHFSVAVDENRLAA